MYARYYFAGPYCADKSVLEVACGVGRASATRAASARDVVGLDIDPTNLASASRTYEGRERISLVEGDAQALPFEDGSFDVVLLFEAIYYLAGSRAVRRRGTPRPQARWRPPHLHHQTKDAPGFNPGAFTHNHYGVGGLTALLDSQGFTTEVYASGAVPDTLRSRAFRVAKRGAVAFGLIPATLRKRAVLKRVVWGPLVRLPRELQEVRVLDYDRVHRCS